MATKSLEQQKAALLQKLQRVNERTRKLETRQKIYFGGAMLAFARKVPKNAGIFLGFVAGQEHREADRDVVTQLCATLAEIAGVPVPPLKIAAKRPARVEKP